MPMCQIAKGPKGVLDAGRKECKRPFSVAPQAKWVCLLCGALSLLVFEHLGPRMAKSNPIVLALCQLLRPWCPFKRPGLHHGRAEACADSEDRRRCGAVAGAAGPGRWGRVASEGPGAGGLWGGGVRWSGKGQIARWMCPTTWQVNNYLRRPSSGIAEVGAFFRTVEGYQRAQSDLGNNGHGNLQHFSVLQTKGPIRNVFSGLEGRWVVC